MSKQFSSAPPHPESHAELKALLQEAKARYAKMSQEEQVSMWACQAIGYVTSELFMAVIEDGRDPSATRRQIEIILHHLVDPDNATLLEPTIKTRLRQLTVDDRRHQIQNLRRILTDLDAIVAGTYQPAR